MKYLAILTFIASLLVLQGCDSEPATPAATTKSSALLEPRQALTAEARAHLIAEYQQQPLTVQNVEETQFQGSNALQVSFSAPLADTVDLAQYLVLADSEQGRLESSWVLAESLTEAYFLDLPPATKLQLQIKAGLPGLAGQILNKEYQQQLTSNDLQAVVGFASKGSLLPEAMAEGLPIISLNVDQVEVDFFRVKADKLLPFISQWSDNNRLELWQAESLLKMAELVYSGRFALETATNTREQSLLPLAGIKPLSEAGLYFAVLRPAGDYSYSLPATVFSISNIGLSVHQSAQYLDIFSQNLTQGAGMSKVEVRVLDQAGKTLEQGLTDSQGILRLNAAPKAAAVIATYQQQTSIVRLDRAALDLSAFDLSGAEAGAMQLYLFAARDLYRPGEQVTVNLLLRDSDGQLLGEQPIKLRVKRPDGLVTADKTYTVSKGFLQETIALSQGAPVGRWTLEAELGNGQVSHYEFSVEDFLPERMALDLTPDRPVLTGETDLVITVKGRYLYGAPADGNSVEAQARVVPLRQPFAELKGFEFGLVDAKPSDNFTLNSVRLDAQGQGQLSLNAQWQNLDSPAQLQTQVSLLESSGRALTRTLQQPIFPTEQLIGIHSLQGNELEENAEAEFELLLTDREGQALNSGELTVKLYQERRDYYWSYSESQGWSSKYHAQDILQERQQIKLTDAQSVGIKLPVKWGSYRLEVALEGSSVSSSQRFWAGYRWQGDSQGLKPDQVALSLDQPAYQVGDVAKISVQSPHAGQGYLLLESQQGVLWQQPISLTTETRVIELPIAEQWKQHDLYISALVVRPGAKKADATPKRAIGLMHLPLARADRQLQVQLSHPEQVRPLQNLSTKVQVLQADGQPARQAKVLLSAVDTGVLSITEFNTPDPFAGFYGRKKYAIDQYDVYHQLIDASQGKLAKLKFGGDAAEDQAGAMRALAKPVIVSLQSEVVQLDEQGQATITLAMPDFNGELRLMAQAWQEDQFGATDSLTKVVAPVVAELAMPRFIGSGDQVQAMLELTNLSAETQQVQLQLSATGLLQLTAVEVQQLTLKPQQRQVIPVALTGHYGFGEGAVNLILSGIELADEDYSQLTKHWPITVRPNSKEQKRIYGQLLQPAETWTLAENAHQGLLLQGATLGLSAALEPPLQINQQIKQLAEYPYDCAEQAVSRALPLLYLSRADLEQALTVTQADAYQAQLQYGVERLLSLQDYNGGFSMWSRSGAEQPWLTVYATEFLQLAQNKGALVPSAALTKAEQRLARYIQESYLIDSEATENLSHYRFAVQAYAGYVLAQQGKVNLGQLRELFERRTEAVAPVPLLQLSRALSLMGDQDRALEALSLGLQLQRPARQWLGDYGTELSDLATMLPLLVEAKASSAAIGQRLQQLSAQLMRQSWLSTQERAAIIKAAASLNLLPSARDQAAGFELSVTQAGQSHSLPAQRSLEQVFAYTEGFSVTNRSEQAVYLQLALSGYPKSVEQAVQSQSLSIERQYFDQAGQPLDLTQVESGQLLVVHLAVRSSQSIPDLLVEDLLPAGLEIENQNLDRVSASLDSVTGELKTWLNAMESSYLEYQAALDDRYVASFNLSADSTQHLLYLARAVSPGAYRLAAPRAESMYRPELQAQGATPKWLTIVPRRS